MSWRLHILTGETASGKSDLALRWAQQLGGEILSCDALLFYRGMDIGTAKPTQHERALVVHHGIDLVDVSQPWTIKDYVEYAVKVVRDCRQRNCPLVVVGGSGFYLKAFFAPVVDEIKVEPALREELELKLREHGLQELVSELRLLNPQGLGTLDICNPRRVLAALARCRASGKRLDQLQAEFAARTSPFSKELKTLYWLQRPHDVLEQRIEERTRRMLQSGLIEEVQKLLKQGLRLNPSPASAIGYREVIAWLDEGGSSSLETLQQAIVRNTLRLVKKQRTWLRRQVPVDRIIDDTLTAAELFSA